MKKESNLTAQIKAPESEGMIFGIDLHNNFHFILKANKVEVKVYQSWNSWGLEARSFTATDRYDEKLKYNITRDKERAWDKNGPSVNQITPGDILITDINLCDGTWVIKPKLKEGEAHRLVIQGHFEIQDSKEAKLHKVWIGHIDTNIEEIVVQKEILNKLNH